MPLLAATTPGGGGATDGGGGGTGAVTVTHVEPLLSPSDRMPWAVDVVSAIPLEILQGHANRDDDNHNYKNDSDNDDDDAMYKSIPTVVVGASRAPWHVLGTIREDRQDTCTFYVWYTPRAASLQEQKHKIPVLKLQNAPQLRQSTTTTTTTTSAMQVAPPSLLLAMQVAPQSEETCYFYIANPITGDILLWKVSRNQLMNQNKSIPANYSAIAKIDLETAKEENHHQQQQQTETLCFLDVCLDPSNNSPRVLVGTTFGNLFWIVQTHAPATLHVQRAFDSQEASRTRKSLFGRLLSYGTSSLSAEEERQMGEAVQKPIVACPAMSGTTQSAEVLAVHETGAIVHWKVHPTASTHRMNFERKVKLHNLVAIMTEFWNSDNTILDNGIEQQAAHSMVADTLQVLQCSLSPDSRALHMIVLTDNTHAGVPASTAVASFQGARLYWLRFDVINDPSQTEHELPHLKLDAAVWLNRFVAPLSTQVAGLVVADIGVGYAAFLQDEISTNPRHHYHHHLPAIVMALDPNDSVVHEVDLPSSHAPSLLLGTLSKDVVTHGCRVLTTSGIGLRVRLAPSQTNMITSPSGIRLQPQPFQRSDPNVVTTLTSHLRSAFWDYYRHPDQPIRMPPSLAAARHVDLEEAIHAVAVELQEKAAQESPFHAMPKNPLDWHLALLSLLQQSGLYRSLTPVCKWKLLAIGQELAVYLTLCAAATNRNMLNPLSEWETEQLSKLPVRGIGFWLEDVQESVFQQGGGEDRQNVFGDWLTASLDVAMKYRDERVQSDYDILLTGSACVGPRSVPPSLPPSSRRRQDILVWTCQESVQGVMKRQIQYWKSLPQTTHVTNIEILVKAMLQAFGDSFAMRPDEDDTKNAYVDVQEECISFLRKVNGVNNDHTAFNLSKEHCYFEGICQIALDHEKKRDKSKFDLVPLFREMSHAMDVKTSIPYNVFVLQWHVDKGYIGRTIKYGQLCPDVLNRMMQSIEALQPYQWIQAVRQGDYDLGAATLIDSVTTGPTMKFPDAKFALNIASLMNHVAESESSNKENAKRRSNVIETYRDLAVAQEKLLGEEAAKESTLLSGDDLFRHALHQVETLQFQDERTEVCYIALAICSTFDTIDERHNAAVDVWFKSFQVDAKIWRGLLQVDVLADEGVRDIIQNKTVFGLLFEKTRIVGETWKLLLFGPVIEREVLERLGSEYIVSMRRLIQSAIGPRTT